MPQRNTVEIGEHGDQIGPNRPEQHGKQRNHHQHRNTQRLLVNLLQGNRRFFLGFGPFSALFNQMLTTRQRTAPGNTPGGHAQAAQNGLVQQVPQHHQVNGFNPAAGQTQRRVEVAGCRQHHQGDGHNR